MNNDIRRVLLGRVGVDSGQLMVIDPCYIDSSWKKGGYDDEGSSYREACDTTMNSPNKGGPTLINGYGNNLAVVFESGFGDGVYEVWAEIMDCGVWGERISRVEIILINDDNEDDDEDEEWDDEDDWGDEEDEDEDKKV